MTHKIHFKMLDFILLPTVAWEKKKLIIFVAPGLTNFSVSIYLLLKLKNL